MARELTELQAKFLVEYQDCINVGEACRRTGYNQSNVRRDAAKDTAFGRAFREIRKNIEKDIRLDKAAGLERLLGYQKVAEEAGDLKLAIDIQKEINKMVEGNIAATTQREIKENKVEIKVLDFTKKKTKELVQGKFEDVEAEIIE